MRVLLFCQPRTRSSYFQDIISQHYKLDNLFEPYQDIFSRSEKGLLFKKPNLVWERNKKEILKTTQNLSSLDNIAVKLFFGQTWNSAGIGYQKDKEYVITNDDLLNVENYHNIKSYDKIFVLQRKNSVDLIVSYYFANFRSQLWFMKNEKYLLDSIKPKDKIKLNASYNDVKLFVADFFIMNYQLNYLKENRIEYTQLYYEDIPNYINSNYPNLESKYLETQHNYKDFVSNYDEIENYIEQAKTEFDKMFLSN